MTVTAAAERRRDAAAAAPGAELGCCSDAARWVSRAICRAAACSSRRRGRVPPRTARTSAARATAGEGGISRTSEPARRACTAVRPGSRPRVTAAISSESVTTRPSKPSSSRSSPVTTLRDSDDGTRGSTARTSRWPTITAGSPASMPRAKGTRSDASSCALRLALHRQGQVAVGRHGPVAREVLDDRQDAGRAEAGGRRDDVLGDHAGPRRGGPRPDRRVAGARRDVGVRGEVDGEAEPAQLRGPGGVRLLRQPRVTGGAGAHEGREPGRRAAQPLDHAALLVDAEEERPLAGDLAGQRPVDGPDLLGRGHVGAEGDHAAEVQVADHPHRGVGPLPVGDDDLPREVGQLHPADDPRRPVQLGPGGTPSLGQPELLRRRRRDGRRARGGRALGRPLLVPARALSVARGQRRDEHEGGSEAHQGRGGAGAHHAMVARHHGSLTARGGPDAPRASRSRARRPRHLPAAGRARPGRRAPTTAP